MHGLFGAIIVEPVGTTWTNPETGLHDMTMAINYRTEPARNRAQKGTGGVGEEVSMSSWPFGDPATPLFEAYTGDNMKARFMKIGPYYMVLLFYSYSYLHKKL